MTCSEANCEIKAKCKGLCQGHYMKWFRSINPNMDKLYEKTPKGFLMRLYRNMESRVKGIQKIKLHLYENKEILSREDFYNWANKDNTFKMMFAIYEASNYDMKLAPSVDRIDSNKGYSIPNMEWVTHSENSRRGSLSQSRKKI